MSPFVKADMKLKSGCATRGNALSNSLFWGLVRQRLAVGALGMALLASPLGVSVAIAREGVDVGKNSAFTKLVPAEDVERSCMKRLARKTRVSRPR